MPRADVQSHPAVGHVDLVQYLHLGVGLELTAGDEVGWQLDFLIAEQLGGGPDALRLAQRRADVVALAP